MAKQSTIAAVSDETKDILEDHVKKGKARKFFLICKGVNISTLEVFKKGPFGPRIMKAKGEGFKGEVTYGVVTGSGKELYSQLAGNQGVAELMKVDSFCDSPPTKKAKLRDFLSDNDLSFRCSFYVITDPALAPDPDSESSNLSAKPPTSCEIADDPEGSVSTTTEESETTESDSSETTTPSETTQFTDRLKALKPEIDRVVASGEPVGTEVKLLVSEAALFARKKELDQAHSKLDQIEALLAQDTTTSTTASLSDLSTQFNKRFAELVARVKAAAGTPQGEQAKLKASEAASFAKNKEFRRAGFLLDEIEKLLGKAESTGPAALERWKTERGKIVKTLHSLAQVIAASKDPEARDAIILIKAIGANLTESPNSLQSVNELERYLVTDDIIGDAEVENGFGIEVRIRDTLLPILADLKESLTA